MSKKLEEAQTSLKKLDELTQDILKNSADGGDPNFRQIVFTGLTQTKNEILLDQMKELLFAEEEADLKKTIILGVFIHKEIFEPVIAYGEANINIPYIDESYDDKESFLFVLDALMELAYKNKLNDYETAIPMLLQIYKIACSEKSSSTLADKLLQRFLNSKIGTIKVVQDELAEIVKDNNSDINEIVIGVDILSRGKYKNALKLIEYLINRVKEENDNLSKLLPVLDISTLAFSYFTDEKYDKKIKEMLEIINSIDFSSIDENNETLKRINKRIKKINEEFNSVN